MIHQLNIIMQKYCSELRTLTISTKRKPKLLLRGACILTKVGVMMMTSLMIFLQDPSIKNTALNTDVNGSYWLYVMRPTTCITVRGWVYLTCEPLAHFQHWRWRLFRAGFAV